MQKKAQFDDRIRNLIALAQDGSERSRTLLFSHISDLFLQGRPMASAVQIRMLTEILKELLDQVELSARQEIATALYELTSPPDELINIMCEDVVEVSGPLLEKANLPDEKLIHIIRYGTEAHRIHISRRFGLSPLVRNELEKAHESSESSKLKYSLNELDKLAEDAVPDMDEETTANILELLRAQKMHKSYPEQPLANPLAAAEEARKSIAKLSRVVPAPFPAIQENSDSATERSTTQKSEEIIKDNPFDTVMAGHLHPLDKPSKDSGNIFSREIAANDAALPDSPRQQERSSQQDSTIHMTETSVEMDDDIWQQVQKARQETNRQREFARTVADWFWEVDRTGLISFISDEAFIVFSRSAPSLIGVDFISLCKVPDTGSDVDQAGSSFESLFEHRSSFRNVPFYISSQNEEKNLWYISAIAIFDIHTGRFAGFRGSACSQTSDEQLSITQPLIDSALGTEKNSGHQEESLEEYITSQALKAVSQDMPTQAALEQEKAEQDASNEEVAEELLQNLSHEFRTPLNAIIGFSEMIDMETWGPVNKKYHQNIKNILTAAVQLKEGVNDVLDSAKLNAGLMQINPESFSLKSVLRNCQENVEAMAIENDVTLLDNDNNIDVILYNDKQSIELCLTKMLASIIKRAKGGEMISPAVLINSNAQVRIELPILGSKISEKEAENMFQRLKTEPCEQENMPSGALKYEPKLSSGFGLSIAQNLSHMIGGDISVHTAQGYITHLVLTLSNHDPAL